MHHILLQAVCGLKLLHEQNLNDLLHKSNDATWQLQLCVRCPGFSGGAILLGGSYTAGGRRHIFLTKEGMVVRPLKHVPALLMQCPDTCSPPSLACTYHPQGLATVHLSNLTYDPEQTIHYPA